MRKKITPFPLFIIKFVIFISCVSIFSAFGTLALHEIGHTMAASYYKCDNFVRFVLGELPYTEMDCTIPPNRILIIFSGFIFTTLISSLLFFSASGAWKYSAGIIFSIGLVAASLDLALFGIGKFWIVSVNIISYLLIAYCIVKISILMFKEHSEIH